MHIFLVIIKNYRIPNISFIAAVVLIKEKISLAFDTKPFLNTKQTEIIIQCMFVEK